jgi:hypothetical protein
MDSWRIVVLGCWTSVSHLHFGSALLKVLCFVAALLPVFFRILRPRRYNSGINPSTLKDERMKDFQRVRESRIGEEKSWARRLVRVSASYGVRMYMTTEICIHSYMKWSMMM